MKNIILFIISIGIFISVVVFLPEYKGEYTVVSPHDEIINDIYTVGIRNINDVKPYYSGKINFSRFNTQLIVSVSNKFKDLIDNYDITEQTYNNNYIQFEQNFGVQSYSEYQKLYTVLKDTVYNKGEVYSAEIIYNTLEKKQDGIEFKIKLNFESESIDLKIKLYNEEVNSKVILKFIEINGVNISER